MIEVINQSSNILAFGNGQNTIINAGRVCYQSFDKKSPETDQKLLETLIEHGHHSVIEHASFTVGFITDRGVTHELVRHRLASFSQESTRYCNYGGSPIEFVAPVWINSPIISKWNDAASYVYKDFGADYFGDLKLHYPTYYEWLKSCFYSSHHYNRLLDMGWRPEQARTVLNNSLKTEIIVTANLREWRHIFKLRCSKKAHPQIRSLMLDLFKRVQPLYGKTLFPNELAGL